MRQKRMLGIECDGGRCEDPYREQLKVEEERMLEFRAWPLRQIQAAADCTRQSKCYGPFRFLWSIFVELKI